MNEENSNTAIAKNFNGRLTRARAAALQSSSCALSSRESLVEQNQKRVLRASLKRAAVDENNNNNTGLTQNPRLPKKRRAGLNDVTNVICQNSYRNCFNATRFKVSMLQELLYVCKLCMFGTYLSHQEIELSK